LEFTKQPYAEASASGMLRLRSTFSVTLESKGEDEEVNLKLHIRCPVLEDEGQEGDDLNLTIDVNGVDATPDPEHPNVLRFAITKGGKATFTVQSEDYDAAWTVRLRPEIDEEVAE
jgi:hypothetical protein